MIKILITSDLHFEKIIIDHIDKCLKFIKDTLEKEKPDIFVIAGDTSDSHNLKSGSDEMYHLIDFIKSISLECKKRSIKFLILRGTKGHDGEIIKNIHHSFKRTEYEFDYYDEPEIIFYNNFTIMMLPELYFPNYKDFIEMMDKKTAMQKPDIIIFHGMMDFVIPQLKQVNSQYNLSRSIVINHNDLKRYFNICAVGGHVHAQIRHRDIIYTDSMINSVGDLNVNKGLGLIRATSNHSYLYDTIPNPYNIIHKIEYLDFISDTLIEINSKVEDMIKEYDINKIVFKAKINSDPIVLSNYSSFIRKFNPKFISKTIITTNETNHETILNYKNKQNLSKEEIVGMIMDIAKNKYSKKMEQNLVNEVLTFKEK